MHSQTGTLFKLKLRIYREIDRSVDAIHRHAQMLHLKHLSKGPEQKKEHLTGKEANCTIYLWHVIISKPAFLKLGS